MALAHQPPMTVAVIGAGPYGLSVAAHMPKHRVQTRVFGMPMESWKRMPERMCLKSVWSASSLADPHSSFTLDRYDGSSRIARDQPIPLAFFLEYARWFQEQAVPEMENACVSRLRHAGGRFQLELADGRDVEAQTVVVAIGVRNFAYTPEVARDLPADLSSHTGDYVSFEPFHGARVAVLGSGQSALESAAFLGFTARSEPRPTRRSSTSSPTAAGSVCASAMGPSVRSTICCLAPGTGRASKASRSSIRRCGGASLSTTATRYSTGGSNRRCRDFTS